MQTKYRLVVTYALPDTNRDTSERSTCYTIVYSATKRTILGKNENIELYVRVFRMYIFYFVVRMLTIVVAFFFLTFG